MKVTTTIYLELAFEIEGEYSPGSPERGPSFSSPGEPGEPPTFSDVTITGIKAEKYEKGRRVEKTLGVYPLAPNCPPGFLDAVLAFVGEEEVTENLLSEMD